MAFCSKCGAQINDGAQFCPQCGQPVNDTGDAQEPVANYSFVNEPEEEQIKTWQKIVSVLFWPAGAVLTIVAFVKKQQTLAKSALIYTGVGFVLAIVLNTSLGGCSSDGTGETEVVSVSSDEDIDISSSEVSDVAEAGYKNGYEHGFDMADLDVEPDAKTTFSLYYGAPKTQEEKKLFNIYKENYNRGYREGKRAGRE